MPDMINVLLYAIIGLSFIFSLLAAASTSERRRKRLSYILLGMLLVLIGVSFIRLFLRDHPHPIPNELYMPIIFWPPLIGRLIVWGRNRSSAIARSKYNPRDLISGIIGTLCFVWALILILPPYRRSVPGLQPIYDVEYFRSRAVFFFSFLFPVLILTLMLALQKTAIIGSGVIHDGVQWAWSDFKNYAWKVDPKDDALFELFLSTKNVSINTLIKLKLPAEDKQRVEGLIAQKVVKK